MNVQANIGQLCILASPESKIDNLNFRVIFYAFSRFFFIFSDDYADLNGTPPSPSSRFNRQNEIIHNNVCSNLIEFGHEVLYPGKKLNLFWKIAALNFFIWPKWFSHNHN